MTAPSTRVFMVERVRTVSTVILVCVRQATLGTNVRQVKLNKLEKLALKSNSYYQVEDDH